ncbi:MAG TPA: molybdopterin-synthase adenylyltransferase MoeB [Pseudomonadales bacterium]|nr:molybdopterin-synthase adenylyltransferase MoeB [Pseudomonadales bacterium]
MELDDEQLLRYSRHILLPQIDISGQQRLLNSSVLIVGLGGLGCPAALYLAAAGIGKLLLNDFDQVELSNLQRQIAHTENSLGLSKAESMKQAVLNLNSSLHVISLPERLDDESLLQQIQQVDVVLDCTDNFAIRHRINAACVSAKKPLVSAAAVGFEAQLSVFDSRQAHSPCYACLYPNTGEEQLSCAENGVLAPLVGVVGALQALEAVKLLLGLGRSLMGRLLVFDALTMQWRELGLTRDSGCPTCGG